MRGSLIQPKMSSVLVIVAHVVEEESLQMSFVQSDNMVEQLTTTTADPALGNAVLPGTISRAFCRSLGGSDEDRGD